MKQITLEELLEAGCHFGHQVNRRNPKADEFIFEERQGVHIINLEKTREGLLAAAEYVKSLSSRGGKLVIIGTKRQAQSIVQDNVKKAQDAGAPGLFYVTSRWVGGTFTNFQEVSKNFKKLAEIQEILTTRKAEEYTKRERLLFEREKEKLLSFYGGVATMSEIPDAVFIIGTHHEKTAVDEARALGVKVVGIVDTNADPSVVDHIIPANDDAVGSIKVITDYLVDAWIEGAKEASKEDVKTKKE